MKILVTGGAGFIGSHLCEKLLSLNQQVFCLDNFNDFYEPTEKRKNIEEAASSANFTLLEGDIREKSFLGKVFSLHNFDVVVHLAAMAGVRPSINKPELCYDVNVTGTLNLLEYYRQQPGKKKLIFASSSSVYGNSKEVPFKESDPVNNPISPYAASKKAGELLCFTYHYLYNISCVCLRYFTVYGARQRPDLAIRKFASLMVANKPLPIYGDLSSQRDYTYIEDIINGTVAAIDFTSEKICYEIFNLGEAEPIPLSAVIDQLEKNLKIKAIINYLPPQDGDVLQTYASLAKSSKMLNYKPKYRFADGMKLFAEWFGKTLQEGVK